jgi:enoyl-CoA hydratase/carnithine racemase
MADIRIASVSARFSTGYINRGLAPGGACALYLPRVVGLSSALELLLTGDLIDAHDAARIGLVSRVVPDAELVKVVAALAARIAQKDPVALRFTKRAVHAALRADPRTVLDLSSSSAAISAARDA